MREDGVEDGQRVCERVGGALRLSAFQAADELSAEGGQLGLGSSLVGSSFGEPEKKHCVRLIFMGLLESIPSLVVTKCLVNSYK